MYRVRQSRYGLKGLAATTGQTALAVGSTAASSGLSIAVAAGAVGGPVGALIGAGIAAASLAIQAIMNSGCGQTCIVSSNFANQANAALQQNIEAFFAPRMQGGLYDPSVPLTWESQQAALANFDHFWAWLQTQCGAPSLGNAGVRCITDRQAGACKWKQPAAEVPPWGTPAAGACWNWFNGYRDPIANASNILPPQSDLSQTVSSAAAGLGVPANFPWLPLAAGLLLLVWAVN